MWNRLRKIATGVCTEPDAAGAPRTPDQSASDCARTVWRYKRTVALSVGVSLLVVGVYLAVATPRYEAEAQLYVQVFDQDNRQSDIQASPFVSATLDAHRHRLTSTPVLRAALADPRLDGLPGPAGQDKPVEWLREGLGIDVLDDEAILSIRFASPLAEEASAVVNAVVAAYLNSQQPFRRSTRQEALELLERSADLLDKPITRTDPAEIPLAIDASVMPLDSDDAAVVGARLTELAQQLTQAQLDTIDARALLEAAEALPAPSPSVLRQLVSSHSVPGLVLDSGGASEMLRSEYMRLERLRQSFADRMGEGHQIVREIDQRMDGAERQARAMQAAEAKAIGQQVRDYAARAIDRERELAQALAEQHQRAEQLDVLPIEVIEAARTPDEPVSPKKARALALALMFGLMSGSGAALARNWARVSRLETLDPPQSSALVTVDQAPTANATVQPFNPTADAPVRPYEIDSQPAAPEIALLASIPDFDTRNKQDPRADLAAFAVHEVRAMIELHWKNAGARSFAVTGSSRGAGRTSVVVGVASSLAASGARTLVVDADLVGRMFREGRIAWPGAEPAEVTGEALDEALAREAAQHAQATAEADTETEASESTSRRYIALGMIGFLDGLPLSECAVPTSQAGLDVLPAVGVKTKHVGKLSSRTIQRLIEEAEPDYDVVLFDTGTIPGSSEALLIASEADATVVVTARDETRTRLEQTRAQLRLIGARVLGMVFNRATERQTALRPPRRLYTPLAPDPVSHDEPADHPATDHPATGAPAAADESAWDDRSTAGSGVLASALDLDLDTEPPRPA
ncbi:MAG: GNVR domain-containing protein [Planctomycetota bacterium]